MQIAGSPASELPDDTTMTSIKTVVFTENQALYLENGRHPESVLRVRTSFNPFTCKRMLLRLNAKFQKPVYASQEECHLSVLSRCIGEAQAADNPIPRSPFVATHWLHVLSFLLVTARA